MICDKWLHVYGNKLGTGVNCEWVYDVRENVRGEWIKHDIYQGIVPWGHDCSVCGHWFVVGEEKIKDYKFCPNCGADMRGEA